MELDTDPPDPLDPHKYNKGAIPKTALPKRDAIQQHTKKIAVESRVEYKNITYNSSDSAPYRVYFELRENTEMSKINKFSLGSTLRRIGDFKKFIIDMKYVGQHKIIVFMSSYNKANSLVEVINSGEEIYKAYIPRHLVCVTGVVTGVPSNIDINELKADAECEVPIVEIKRMTKKTDEGVNIPLNRLIITFRASELPSRIKIFCCASRVTPFTPKVIVCLKCLRFGHRTDNCRGTKRCDQCTARHETISEYQNCQNEKKCIHCRSKNHLSTDENCPERKRQQDIKFLMARKNLTYVEAKEQIPMISRNIYEPLRNAEDYPSLNESFATLAGGQYRWKNPLKEQWMKTNEERKAIQAAINTGTDQNKLQHTGVKRSRQEPIKQKLVETTTSQRNIIIGNDTINGKHGVMTNNAHRVTECEQWETKLRQIREKMSRSQKEMMMSFYTDFINMLGTRDDVKEMFNTCTKKHFNLAEAVVLDSTQCLETASI